MYHGELNYMARMKFMNTEIDNLTMQETLDAIDKIIAKGMNKISCREQSGCNLVHKYVGKEAVRVLDPTLLLSADEWRNIEHKLFFSDKKPYLCGLWRFINAYYL